MTREKRPPQPPELRRSFLSRLRGPRACGAALGRRDLPSIGRHAERLVAAELARRRMSVLQTNFATRFGEIDVVARKGRTIVFVEVKARSSLDAVLPAEAVTPRKQKRIARAAKAYLARHAIVDADVRFDVAEVIFAASGSSHEIRFIEDAFVPPA
ncbi:MAG: YraN family protein [Planctomycetota bacterium]